MLELPSMNACTIILTLPNACHSSNTTNSKTQWFGLLDLLDDRERVIYDDSVQITRRLDTRLATLGITSSSSFNINETELGCVLQLQ